MDMTNGHDNVRNTVLRMVLVLCVTAGFGLLFFQLEVLNMKMMASQFLTSGVTAGVSYAAWKSSRWRDGLAALVVWYFVETFLITEYNWWLLVLSFAYIAGIGAGMLLFVTFVRKEIVHGMMQRIAAAGVIIAIANAIIIVFLGFWSWTAVKASPGYFASMVFRNLQFGTLIGVGIGLGAECAEYIILRLSGSVPGASGLAVAGASPGAHHESTVMHGETIVVNCASCGKEIEPAPAEVASETYTCPYCGTPGTM